MRAGTTTVQVNDGHERVVAASVGFLARPDGREVGRAGYACNVSAAVFEKDKIENKIEVAAI